MATIINQKNGKVVIHATANVNSNVSSFQLSGETISGLALNSVAYGSNGSVVIKRGANNILFLTDTGDLEFAGNGFALSQDADANVVIEITGTGFCILDLQKIFAANNTYDYYEN